MSIFKIDNKYMDLMQLAEDNEGDITDLVNEFTQNDTDRRNKMENCWNIIKTWQSDIDVINKEYERLKAIRTKKEKNIEKLMEIIKHSLLLREETKFNTNLGSFRITNSKAVKILDENELAEEYIRTKTTREANKELIKKAIDAGLEVKGAEIITNKSLRVE